MTRVVLITPWNPSDPLAWSGVVAPMVAALEEQCELTVLSTCAVPDALLDRLLARLLDRRWGKKYLVGQALATSLKRSRWVDRRIRRIDPDAVLAVAASQDIAFTRFQVPLVQVSDTTLKAILSYYDLFTDLHAISRWQARLLAYLSARRATHTLAATAWAKDRLMADDKIGEKDITVAPFGPGIAPPTRVQSRPETPPLKVLAVISDWKRKGGDRVVKVHDELTRRGIPVGLSIVGDAPMLPRGVIEYGRVSQEELSALYANHHVLLELARSNAAGVTLTDAAAFGLPVVATRTGGVETIVLDGQTGVLLPNEDDAVVEHAVAAIKEVSDDLQSMSAQARRHSEEQLNWCAWAESATRLLSRLVLADKSIKGMGNA